MTVLDHLWLDGELRAAADATVSAVDHGVTVGDGVFETMQVLRGEAFALGRHLRRLRRSADVLRLDLPYDEAALRDAVGQVISANDRAGRVRITVTGGFAQVRADDKTEGLRSVLERAQAGQAQARADGGNKIFEF